MSQSSLGSLLSLSLGALALSLAAAGYLWHEKFLILPQSLPFLAPRRTLRRPKSKSDLRDGSFDSLEDWIRSKNFVQGSARTEPQLEKIIFRLLEAIEEVWTLAQTENPKIEPELRRLLTRTQMSGWVPLPWPIAAILLATIS